MDSSFFVVIEGLDGSGKTQISRRLKRTLYQTHSQDVELTFEPHDPSTAGLYIRQVLTHRIKNVQPRTLALAFALNRADHNDRVINPFLDNRNNRILICDRYYLSSLVYQTTPGVDMDEIMHLNRGARKPDLTIFLNASASVCYERMRKRPEDKELFEQNLAETRDKYLAAIEYLRARGERIVEINADDDMETVLNRVIDSVLEGGPEWLLVQRPLIEETQEVFPLPDLTEASTKAAAIIQRFADQQALADEAVEQMTFGELALVFAGYLSSRGYRIGEQLPWTDMTAYRVEYDMPLGLKQCGTLLLLTDAMHYDSITKKLQTILDQVASETDLTRLSDFMLVLDASPAKSTPAYYEQDANGERVSPVVRIMGRREIARLVFDATPD